MLVRRGRTPFHLTKWYPTWAIKRARIRSPSTKKNQTDWPKNKQELVHGRDLVRESKDHATNLGFRCSSKEVKQ